MLNELIREKNEVCCVESPRFKLDMIRTHKAAGK